MADVQPTSHLKQALELSPGFQSWLPYQSAKSCCAPIAHFRVEKLSITYHDRLALQSVTLQINKGCLTALAGPSGCGKTSVLMSINRLTDLIPGCQVSGHVHINELDVMASSTNLLHLRRQVDMIFQKPTVFPFSIKKNLGIALREHGMYDQTLLASTIETALQQVGLWNEAKNRLNPPAQTLSGGQQQRLCLGFDTGISSSRRALQLPEAHLQRDRRRPHYKLSG